MKINTKENRNKIVMLMLTVLLPIILIHRIDYIGGYTKIIVYFIYSILMIFLLLYLFNQYSYASLISFYIVITSTIVPFIIKYQGYGSIMEPKKIYLYTMTIIIVLIFLHRGFKRKYGVSSKFNIDKKDIMLFVFYIFIILSTVHSISIKRSIFGKMFWYEGIITISCYLILFIMASKYYKFNKLHVNFFLCISSVISLIGILQFYGYDINGLKVSREVYATIGQHDWVGAYAVTILPIAMFAYIYCKNNYKYLFIIASSLIYLCMLASFARGSWVGFIFMIIFGFYLCFKYKKNAVKKYIALVVLLGIITIAFNISSGNRMFKRANSIGNDMNTIITGSGNYERVGSNRGYIWKKTIGVIPYNLLLGSGPDTLDLEFKKVYGYYVYDGGKDGSNKGDLVTKAHNEYLHIAATLGIPALIIYLILIIYILKISIKKANGNKYLIPLICSMVAYLVQAFFNNSVIPITSVFWILIGITYKLSLQKENDDFYTITSSCNTDNMGKSLDNSSKLSGNTNSH